MSTDIIDRAKTALSIKSDSDLAKSIDVTPATVGGYRARGGSMPIDKCIKVSELSGVSLDWLILGKEKLARIPPDPAAAAKYLPIEQQMLITGWSNLDKAQQDYIFALLFQIARGDKGVWPPHEHDVPTPAISQVVHGNVGQQSAGDAHIDTLTISDKKK